MSGDAVKDHAKESQELVVSKEHKRKKNSRETLPKYDIESLAVSDHHSHESKVVKWYVIFQIVGVVYGDIGTSPLYVYASTFTNGINHEDNILGVLSLIFYTLTLIALIKYVFIVLQANDNGGGGTFALYSLICRYAKVGLIPSQQAEDCNVTGFQHELPGKRPRTAMASKLEYKLENSQFAKLFLLITAMLGTSMVIGDGVLTPCVSGSLTFV